MGMKAYPVIDLVATGDNIRRLRLERGLTVRDPQSYFGQRNPSTHKWQKGESLPTVDNLYALGIFEVPMDQILVRCGKTAYIGEQQAESCCSSHIKPASFLDTARVRCNTI